MSVLRRFRRRHRSTRSKAHTTVGLEKFTASNEHASQRDRLTTERVAGECTGKFVPSSGENDRLPTMSSRTDEANNNEHRTSTVSVSQAKANDPPAYATILDCTKFSRDDAEKFPKYQLGNVLQDPEKLKIIRWKQGSSDWHLTARIASFLFATAGAVIAGSATALGFTMVFAFICYMLLCKWHGRRPVTLPSAEDDSLRLECFKSSMIPDQKFPSGKFVSSQACANLTPLPGGSVMEFKPPIDNVALRKLSKLDGAEVVHPSSSTVAIDSATAYTRNVPSEDYTAAPKDSYSGKLRTRFKSKSLLRHLRKKQPFSAPSSPMGSSNWQSPFSEASMPNKSALNRYVIREDLDRASADQPRHSFSPLDLTSDQEVSLTWDRRAERRFPRPVSSLQEERKRKKPARIGSTWTAVGMLITIGGLFGGRMVAIVGLVFWWLLLSKVRRPFQ